MDNPSTRNQIVSVFLNCLEIHSLSKITVADLSRKVGISRSVFYHYFSDIFELLVYASRNSSQDFLIGDHCLDDIDVLLKECILLWVNNRNKIQHVIDSITIDKLIFLYQDCPSGPFTSLIANINRILLRKGYSTLNPRQELHFLQSAFSFLNNIMVHFLYRKEEDLQSFVSYTSFLFQNYLTTSAIGIVQYYR